ncbi:DUF3016 domain-containing protein [Rhodanobacter lindaniclasticus]
MATGSDGTNYLEPLKTYLIERATKMLPAGDRLEVSITDMKLAGGYEPWHGAQLMHVRFMRSITPLRTDINFKLIGSNGEVLREGSRKAAATWATCRVAPRRGPPTATRCATRQGLDRQLAAPRTRKTCSGNRGPRLEPLAGDAPDLAIP